MGSVSRNSTIQGMNLSPPEDPEDVNLNSPLHQLHQAEGICDIKEVQIIGTGSEVITNLFIVDCNTELKAIWGVFTEIVDTTTLNSCYFDLWDGTTSKLITSSVTGANCNGAVKDSLIAKMADKTAVATFNNASDCQYEENANFNKAFFGGLMTAKFGTETFIRFRANTDANTDCKIEFTVQWVRRCTGAKVRVAP
jgi:hypothetical protein